MSDQLSEQLSDEAWSPSHLWADDDEDQAPEQVSDAPRRHLTCGICLQEHGDDPVEALECGHVFHTVCLQDWFQTATPAPMVGDCPNRCHLLLRGQQQVPTHAEEHMSEQVTDAEMLELFG